VQFYLLLVYPVAAAPVFLAYGARYAFDSEAAFYVVILLHLVLASVLYWVALESAVGIAQRRKEEIITTLSQVSGPVGS
jgi:ABC-2 type transport system permease protein